MLLFCSPRSLTDAVGVEKSFVVKLERHSALDVLWFLRAVEPCLYPTAASYHATVESRRPRSRSAPVWNKLVRLRVYGRMTSLVSFEMTIFTNFSFTHVQILLILSSTQQVSDFQRYTYGVWFWFFVWMATKWRKTLQTQPCQSKVHLISCLNYTKRRTFQPREYFTDAFFGKSYFSKSDESRFLSICFLTHKCFFVDS